MKADNKYFTKEEDEEESKYTNFEHLKAKVQVLQEELELVGRILKQNNLVYKQEEEVDTDIDDSTFRKLDEDSEEN